MIVLKGNVKTKIFSVWNGDEKVKEFSDYREAKKYKEQLIKECKKTA